MNDFEKKLEEGGSYFASSNTVLSKPRVNVISKEEFEERASKIFKILWEKLSLSFGPYGAPTMIYNYPFKHVTKDGFTIMKNISFDASESKIDQTIADLAESICARLNFSVGDGTTTAVIATNSVYESYIDLKDFFKDINAMPKDIITQFGIVKDRILEKLRSKAVPVRRNDPVSLASDIYDVVYISSNGDEKIATMISDLYKELGCPSITCQKSDNGLTYSEVIDGYRLQLMLNDRLYINTDNNELSLHDADVIVLGTRVTESIYKRILVPLNEACRERGRRLIVAANAYDDVALKQVISRDLNAEYSRDHKINMVLTTYRAVSEHHRKMVEDFAALCGTEVLSKSMTEEIISKVWNGDTQIRHICEVLPIDNRNIPEINVVRFNPSSNTGAVMTQEYVSDEYTEYMETIEKPFTVGYARGCELGMKMSRFKKFFCDDVRIEALRKEAYDEYVEKEEKYKNLGTFNLDVGNAMQRYYALKLKTGIINVGGDSDLSQGMNRDTIDDAVKAAASAYDYGIVLGCNVNLIQSCDEVRKEVYNELIARKMSYDDNLTYIICVMLTQAFCNVYRTVLKNASEDSVGIYCQNGVATMTDEYKKLYEEIMYYDSDGSITVAYKDRETEIPEDYVYSIHDAIIDMSVDNNFVYNLSTKKFTKSVINSLRTDEEVLIATIELISLLIAGNQVIITQRNNY